MSKSVFFDCFPTTVSRCAEGTWPPHGLLPANRGSATVIALLSAVALHAGGQARRVIKGFSGALLACSRRRFKHDVLQQAELTWSAGGESRFPNRCPRWSIHRWWRATVGS